MQIRRSVERISDSVEGPLEEIFIKEEDEELTEIVINEDTSVENVVCRLVEPSTSSVEGWVNSVEFGGVSSVEWWASSVEGWVSSVEYGGVSGVWRGECSVDRWVSSVEERVISVEGWVISVERWVVWYGEVRNVVWRGGQCSVMYPTCVVCRVILLTITDYKFNSN